MASPHLIIKDALNAMPVLCQRGTADEQRPRDIQCARHTGKERRDDETESKYALLIIIKLFSTRTSPEPRINISYFTTMASPHLILKEALNAMPVLCRR
jgi:hypothetical protein